MDSAKPLRIFQLFIDKVLMGCSKFAMGYLDDIIIFSNNEIEHLRHIEEIFTRLEHFGLKMKRETHPVSGPCNSRRWIYTTPRETREYSKHAKTKNTKRSKTVPRLNRLLQEVRTKIFRHNKISHESYKT